MAKLEGVKVIDMVGGEVTKIAYDGEEYAKVDDPSVGDIAVITNSWADSIKEGDFYDVVKVTNFIGKTYVHINGWANGYVTNMQYFRKTSAQPTLTDRVDELETRVSALEEGGKATENLVGKFAKFNRNDLDITKGEYYEIVDKKPAQVISGDPQVGDKIRIVNAWMAFGEYENGDILTVRKVDSDKDVRVEEHDGVICRKEFEIISRPEKSEEPALKVGDYAKVVEHDNDIYFGGDSTPVGDIVKVVKIREDSPEYYYRVEELNGGNYGHNPNACKDALVPATDEEVAEAKRKLAEKQKAEAEAKKWAEIGRSPREFKVGDIISYDSVTRGRKIVGEVESLSNDVLRFYTPGFGMNEVKSGSDRVELVTPVERRFDR